MSTLKLPHALYWSHAPESVYAVVRQCAQGIAELDTLDSDDTAERREKLRGADIVIVAARPLAAVDLENASALRLVHHQGVGYHDTVPLGELARRGIRLALTPEGTTVGVAEHTILLMLAACKRLCHVDSELRRGHWHINTYRSESREIAGMTIGLVGFGRIGQAVATRLVAFGVHIVYHDVAAAGTAATAAPFATPLALDELLATADIVSLHLPLTPASRHILDAARLATMKRGAIVVNASRGGLLDEEALFAALASGHLAGAGLDCFEHEPPPPDHPLFALPNVVVTPHIAAATIDALTTKMRALFANVRRWRDGEPLLNEVALSIDRPVANAPATATDPAPR